MRAPRLRDRVSIGIELEIGTGTGTGTSADTEVDTRDNLNIIVRDVAERRDNEDNKIYAG